MQFIELKKEITLGRRTYPAGAVVEIDKYRRKELVDRNHAVDHPGPAHDPSAPGAEDRPEADPGADSDPDADGELEATPRRPKKKG